MQKITGLLSTTLSVALVSIFVASTSQPVMGQSLVKRGDYLVNTIGTCANCHTPKGGPMKGKAFSGGDKFGGPKAPFTAFAANITQDKETGIGSWTDSQIIAAIREGVRPDGSVVGPPMAIELYRNISDNDVKAMVAYLRTVKPVKNKVTKSTYRIPLHKGKPVGHVADVPKSNPIKYGEYLAGPVGHCVECHTPQIRGRFDFKNQMGRGGRDFRGPWGVSVSRNITPHPEDGLGKWSKAQIKKTVTTGIRPDGTKLFPPMAYQMYKGMTDSDLDAVASYLKSLKPLPAK